MEAPSRLERMQSMLAFIDSHGFSSRLDLHSDRFLADLLLFFVQPGGILSVEKKFSLALDFLNKVTPEVIEELRCLEFDDTDQDLIQKIKTPSRNLTGTSKFIGLYLHLPGTSKFILHDSDPFKFAFNFSWYNTPSFQIGDSLLFCENEISVFCKLGDDKWDIIGPGRNGEYRCFYLKGLLFMVERLTGIIKIMDVSTHKVLYVISPPEHENRSLGSYIDPYLVESCGEILVVCYNRSNKYMDYIFYIHCLEFGNGKGNPCWVKLSSIGDRILFLELCNGCGRGLCLRASDFAGFKGNCIYFTIKVSGYFFDHVNVVNMYDIENGETTFIDTPFNKNDLISWFMPTLNHM